MAYHRSQLMFRSIIILALLHPLKLIAKALESPSLNRHLWIGLFHSAESTTADHFSRTVSGGKDDCH